MKLLIWGIYLVVLCLPLYLVRFEIFGIPTTVLEVLIYGLFVFWLIKKLQVTPASPSEAGRASYKLQVTKLFIPIIFIVIGVSLATIFSTDLRASAGIWKGWFIDPLLFFVVAITTIKNLKQIKGVLYSLFLSGTIVSIISLIYLIQGKFDPVGRLQAFYNSPNYLAMYLAPALIVGVGYYLFTFLASPSETRSGTPPSLPSPSATNRARSGCITRKKIISNASILVFFAIILLSVILFFTNSFSAWLGIIAAVCFGIVFYLYKSGRKKFALTILYLALLIIVFLGYFALIQKESSFDARIIIWQKAWQIFKVNSILGIGPGTFGNYFLLYPEWGVPQPHNIFLAFLLQTGIIGFIGFIWLLIWFFRTGVKLRVTGYGLQVTSLMSIMVYILVHGLVDTTYWKNDLSVLFWTVIALMAVFRHLKIRNFIR